jgi:LppP/LprE lipoprotein
MTSRYRLFLALLLALGLALLPTLRAQTPAPATSWLDKPLANWNKPGTPLPRAALDQAARQRLIARCKLEMPASTAAERALTEAGWIPFLNFDQSLVRDGIEIVDGMADADGMCRPLKYNIFVFVDGRFAGTLSPALMNSREDLSSGTVRILGADSISSEFSRYLDKDALCCPSSRVTVRYRVDRVGTSPVVAPTDVRVTRGA